MRRFLLCVSLAFATPTWAEPKLVIAVGDETMEDTTGDVETAIEMEGDNAELFLKFTPDVALAYANLTETHIGQEMEMLFCDKVIVRAIVRERAEGALILVPQEMETARQMERAFRGEYECPDGND